MMQHMLTTIDNPFDPFTQFDDWLHWDEDAGYYSNQYLARVAHYSPEQSDVDQELAIELAIDEIIKENILGIYRKVSRKYPETVENS